MVQNSNSNGDIQHEKEEINKNNDNNNNNEFPDKPEWLTKELFSEFLEKDFPNFTKITKFNVKRAVAAGENFMTTLLRVHLEVEMPDASSKSTSYMVKIKPKSEQIQNMIEEWQIFKKEQLTYSKYIPKFEEFYSEAGKTVEFAPKLMQLQSDRHNSYLLIMEDLRLRDFKNATRQLGLDMEHTKAVLKKLAQFHAASARYVESVEEFPTMYDQCMVTGEDVFAEHRLNSGKIFRANLHLYGDVEYLKEKLKKCVETQSDPYQMKSERNPSEFNVLNHGDLWVNNIMFQYNEDGSVKETYFIDFQLGRYSSPAQDLQYFLYSSTNIEIKLKHFDYFIAYYHGQLIEHLKLLKYEGKMPSLRDIHMAMYKHDYWAYSIATNLMPVILCESREDANIDNVIGGEEGNAFRQAMYTNSRLAENMSVLLPWLDNRGAFEV
ncbi:uncharacterized protein [Musca autumnalis]|uniref:uncharacterized protein n=1 Tax=Musca autumnalis TaxID=221902 RepID=UPI003CF9EE1C